MLYKVFDIISYWFITIILIISKHSKKIMKATTTLWLERKIRPQIVSRFPPKFVIQLYSKGRLDFLEKLDEESEEVLHFKPRFNGNLGTTLWGIKFDLPLMNAAGMFRGECYKLSLYQCAGGYMGGTETVNARRGFEAKGIRQPFVSLPRSGVALNKLSLPNIGDIANRNKVSEIIKLRYENFPLAWSVSYDDNIKDDRERLKQLIGSLKNYEHLGVDFIELNESCPNTEEEKGSLEERLKFIKENFLDQRSIFSSDRKRKRLVPLEVKFSNDTEIERVPELMDILFEYGFDGVNFGNTSTDYPRRREQIDPREQRVYDFFTTSEEFGVGGGVSGRVLKEDSLRLCAEAVRYKKEKQPKQEFHVIRTGGIENAQDLLDSEKAGISLNQWYTGYMDNLAIHGHNVYRNLYEELESLKIGA